MDARVEEDNRKRILNDVFGESSDEEEEELKTNLLSWEGIKEIKGLWICRDFLSSKEQASLLSAIANEGWFMGPSKNQAMRFGDLPVWATELSRSIREAVYLSDCCSVCSSEENFDSNKKETCPVPSDLLWREPLFDQLIVNMYQPGEGICSHVDLMRFEDGIAIVSLESSCVMHFTRVERKDCGSECGEAPVSKIPVFLTPGSLIVMSGEARYMWKHEINRKPGFQVWGDQEIHQLRRTSVTMRKLCPSESLLKYQGDSVYKLVISAGAISDL